MNKTVKITLLITMSFLTSLFGLGCNSIKKSNANNDTQQAVIQSLDVNDFMQEVNNDQDVQLVDVRTPQEHQAGHITGSKLINVTDANFAEQAQKQLNSQQPVAVYCRSGRRSMMAAKTLRKLGFNKIYNLKGGYIAYEQTQR